RRLPKPSNEIIVIFHLPFNTSIVSCTAAMCLSQFEYSCPSQGTLFILFSIKCHLVTRMSLLLFVPWLQIYTKSSDICIGFIKIKITDGITRRVIMALCREEIQRSY